METYLLDWANLLLRWLHVIVAIAWIGSSFYFVFLDSNLEPPKADDLKQKGVDGAIWSVHGGGFYHAQKYMVAPKGGIDSHLHWFYWESYSTWLSGFALFLISYLWSPSVYLIDPKVMDWSPAGSIAAALGFLVVFWLLYDAICRTLGQSKNGDAKVGALVLVLVCVAAYASTHMFAGRAAFLITGAMIATAMSANVFFWIIPGQRTVVADLKAGKPVNPIHGQRAKQRSVHNTYFTLPVLFAMLSNHYSFTYAHPQNWLILIGMMFAGAAIRQFFVLRHGFKLGRNPHPWKYAAVGVAVLVALIVWLKPAPVAAVALPETVSFAQVQPIIEQRCVMCHGAALQSKGVRLDSPAEMKAHAQAVYQQVVVSKIMPMNNATGITEEERAIIGKWFKDGAKVE